MPLWQVVLDVVAVLVGLVLLYGVGLVVRRRTLSRHGGTFELSVRSPQARPGHGWVLGLGRYAGGRLEWFRIFSLSPRPKRAWQRTELEYVSRRAPQGPEAVSLYDGHLVVECTTPDGVDELAMSASSLMGLQAWLEAKPPGTTEHV
ncbi:DUF2550 domain-containing protein [Nocardioides zeae]|uniref:DUF2550 domain-containing protein n=1 Tax=Nocardioides imazamoxiresistens TaxID=3231893 RepID=A0ABU3Q0S2_9ACTN|nr:DUF2550 domain-containing protein [Nocardioides zeae]MDT9595113.1 DUF2550 domain-containing protein [Nocardioides zeae]